MLLSSDTLARRLPLTPPPTASNLTPQTWSVWLVMVWTAALILGSHNFTVLSLEPDAIAAPSGLTSTLKTQLEWPDMEENSVFPSASYMWMRSSSEPETRTLGSRGEYERDRTGIVWPSRWWRNLARCTSKTEMEPSMDPHASCLPLGLHATDKTNFLLFPLSEGLEPSGRGIDKVAISFHSAVSHSLTDALLPPATARVVPCGEHD